MKFVRHRRLVVTVAIFTVLILTGVVALRQFLQPVSATNFTTVGNPTAQATATPVATPVEVSDTYASFSYPSTMQPMQGQQGAVGNELAVYNYKKADTVPWHLAISIDTLHGPTLDNDGGYLLRANNPSEYKESSVTYGNTTYTVMTDTQAEGFAEVAYSLHGSTVAEISLTGDSDSGTSGMAEALQLVMQSWQWK